MDNERMVQSFAQQQALQDRANKELEMNRVKEAHDAERAQMGPRITDKEVMAASEILRKYKEGKARLESKIIANEQFWKLRQWGYYGGDDKSEKSPATALLWKMIQSRHSDVMESYPTCNFKARQQDDKAEAKRLSDIIPVILEQNRYEETYSDIAWYGLKQGAWIQGVFWDGSKHNGLGDIAIKKIDILNFFWEPGVTNLQDSDNVFTVELVENRILEQRYPQTKGKLGGEKITVAKYLYDDNIDTTDKSVVVDWYYHTEYNGRKALQYVKYVNDIVLYATENETEVPTRDEFDQETGIAFKVPTGEPLSVRGLYDHNMYPFVVQDLYPIEGSICGYGLTDIGRDTQMQIDILNKAVVDNAVVTAKPRYFVRNDGSINPEEFMNTNNPLVPVAGSLNDDYLRPIESTPLNGNCITELQNKIEELKYVTSNQDVANGAAPSGITAASAIAALQETAGKDSRVTNQAFHRAFRDVCYMIVELIRQFYDTPRSFRIVPDSMGEQFIDYSNQGLVAQPQMLNGKENGLRLPEFDIEVTSEKASPYKKMEQNELALNFYKLGFFNPQIADQALSCLDMMDFAHKDEVMQKVQQNGTLMQKLLKYQQLSLQLAQQLDPALAQEIGNTILEDAGQAIPQASMAGDVNLDKSSTDEHPYVEKARKEAEASTQAD